MILDCMNLINILLKLNGKVLLFYCCKRIMENHLYNDELENSERKEVQRVKKKLSSN